MFNQTEIDFTYPKHIRDSTVEHEFLEDFPKIKFKRICILMGANASGKTTLGRLMCSINNYLYSGNASGFKKAICDKSKTASFQLVYVLPKKQEIYQLETRFNSDGLIYESLKVNKLYASKSLNKTLADLENSEKTFEFNHFVPEKNYGIAKPGFSSVALLLGQELDDNQNTLWSFLYSDLFSSSDNFKHPDTQYLERILKAFDNSIKRVSPIKETQNAYVIRFSNGDDVIVQDGEINNARRLSRGTIESIEIANFIYSINCNKKLSGTYYLDEKMAYSHSEMEIAILNLLIEKLNSCSQLFYTTHNYNILDMNLPSHSFIFLRKEDFIRVCQPEKLGLTKNDRSLLGYVKNDVFGTIPDTSLIDDML